MKRRKHYRTDHPKKAPIFITPSNNRRTTYYLTECFYTAVEETGISVWLLDLITKTMSPVFDPFYDYTLEIHEDSIKEYPSFDDEDQVSDQLKQDKERQEYQLTAVCGKVHPDDAEAFRAMFARVWNGEDHVRRRIRHWSEERQRYSWFEYRFSILEGEDEIPQTSLVAIRDIFEEQTTNGADVEKIETGFKGENNLLSCCCVNLSKEAVEGESIPPALPGNFKARSEMLFSYISLSPGEKESLSAESLKSWYLSGNHNFQISYWAILRDSDRMAWVQTECVLEQRRENGDIIAFFYDRDFSYERLAAGVMNNLALHSLERAGAVFTKTGTLRPIFELTEPYSADENHIEYDQWLDAYCREEVIPDDRAETKKALSLPQVISHLNHDRLYSVQYDVKKEGVVQRKQTIFSYLDQKNGVILISRTDIALYEQLRYISEHDPLTGLYNRGRTMKEIRKAMGRHAESPFLFAQIDICKFKRYNSLFGEEEGNRLLKFMANKLRKLSSAMENCVVGRVQADVFFLCASGDKEKFISQICDAVTQWKDYRQDYLLQFAVGIYPVSNPAVPLEEMIANAAIAAQKCKEDIHIVYSIYDADEEKQRAQEEDIRNQMQSALKEKQFKVWLQPKFRIDPETCHGAEALVRWLHPQKGLISPGVFIPVFEKNGFIAELDLYVWEEVCALLARWLDAGYTPFPVSVNVSRVSLYNQNLAAVFVNLTKKYKIPPRLLHLEITESAYMSNPDAMRRIIEDLHQAGFHILMDDFGSGYSSLNTLKEFHIDTLKIDMKFLPINNDVKRGEVILASVIRMAKWLGMDVIMEGVETKEQQTFLRGIGCDYIQGYFYEKPMPADTYEEKYVRVPAEQPTIPDQKIQRTAGKEILVIDDDPIGRKLVHNLLAGRYPVTILKTAEEGLAYLQKNFNDVGLILCDNVLPGMYGVDFLSYCQQVNIFRRIPKIIITADSSQEVRLQALSAGADALLTKPFDPDILYAYVDKWLSTDAYYTVDAIYNTFDFINEASAVFVYHSGTAYFEFANSAYYKLFHATAQEAVGASYEKLIAAVVHPDDAETVREMLTALSKNGICEALARIRDRHNNKYLWLTIRGKLIEERHGTTAYLTFSDVTAQHEQITREKMLSTCYSTMASDASTADAIEQVFAVLSRFYNGERVYVFEIDWERDVMSNTHEWVADGVTREMENLQNLSLSTAGAWLQNFQKGEPICIDNLEEIRSIPERRVEYEILAAQNIHSLMTAPISYGGRVYGHIGVDNPKEHCDDKGFLQSTAYYLSRRFYEDYLLKHIRALENQLSEKP